MTLAETILLRCRQAVDDPALPLDGDLYEFGLDSIGLLELAETLSAQTGAEVLVSDLFECATAADIVSMLSEVTERASTERQRGRSAAT